MAAGDHLNEVQFSSPHELAKHWDPNLKNPEAYRSWSGPKYIDNLKSDISQRGIQNPIQVTDKYGFPMLYDGHHRLIAAMDLGLEKVPWKWVSGRPGEQ